MDVENGEALSPDDIADIHREADEDIRAKMKLKVNTRYVLVNYLRYYYAWILNNKFILYNIN